ncbi:MAG: hypothetical protein HYS81_01680 [Candidatus Aenigmatarchaeota archaeon]|nr:MAG: hypothetical protein HYS81_01680 [Candidatus Aenigmarchaeota archaeon]
MSEFAKTVMIGLLLLAAAIVSVSGDIDFLGSPSGAGYRFSPSGGTLRASESGDGEDIFFVGTGQVEDFARKTLASPFAVSYLKQDTVHASFKNLTVARGLFRNQEERVSFEIGTTRDIKGGTLSGKVINTNRYGAFIVKLNQKTIFNKAMKIGDTFETDVSPDLFVNGTNELVIGATSSGWRLWAPTVFIADVAFTSGQEGAISKNMDFSIPSDRIPANKGRFVFRAERTSGNGTLSIRLNDEQIFNQAPSNNSLTIVDVAGSIVKTENNATFKASGNASYQLSSLEFIYFYNRGPAINATKTFTLTKKDVEALPGTLEIKISKVVGSPTALWLDVVRPDRTTTRVVPQGILETGNTLSVTLTKANVAEGTNTVKFYVTGRGGYEISRFEAKP